MNERKQITQEELDKMIKSHEQWLETFGDEGERLVLKDVNINECIIKDCSLMEAIFDLLKSDDILKDLSDNSFTFSRLYV